MPTPSTFAAEFAEAIQFEYADYMAERYPSQQPPEFVVMPGRRFDKIAKVESAGGRSVHCFIERATGHVYKAEGWSKPAKGVRFTSPEAALAAWSPHGGYLYAR